MIPLQKRWQCLWPKYLNRLPSRRSISVQAVKYRRHNIRATVFSLPSERRGWRPFKFRPSGYRSSLQVKNPSKPSEPSERSVTLQFRKKCARVRPWNGHSESVDTRAKIETRCSVWLGDARPSGSMFQGPFLMLTMYNFVPFLSQSLNWLCHLRSGFLTRPLFYRNAHTEIFVIFNRHFEWRRKYASDFSIICSYP